MKSVAIEIKNPLNISTPNSQSLKLQIISDHFNFKEIELGNNCVNINILKQEECSLSQDSNTIG